MPDWRSDARAALARGPTALVTILATEGSVPRGAGTRMVVTPHALHGTIGGGALEWRVVAQARAILAEPPGAWRMQDYPLGPLLGQCCGGRVRLLVERLGEVDWMASEDVIATLRSDRVERTSQISFVSSEVETPSPVRPDGFLDFARNERILVARGPRPAIGDSFVEPSDEPRRPLMLFGAGHVGRAIAARLPGLPFDLAWFDGRAEADRPGVTVQDEDALVARVGEAAPEAAVLVLTHDHALDYRLTAAALQSRASFVGLIGSATKRARFVARLTGEGVATDRLTCPIGLPDVAGKAPAVIAISVLAQLLQSDSARS